MLTLRLLSALEKVFPMENTLPAAYERGSALGGERFAFQVVLDREGWGEAPVSLSLGKNSPLEPFITGWLVEQVPCELPAYPSSCDEDYLQTTPGLFPDVLSPISSEIVSASAFMHTVVWVEVAVPKGFAPGIYSLSVAAQGDDGQAEAVFQLDVIGADLPPQTLLYTQWFHVDSIAVTHGVPVYSQQHWTLMEKYIELAVQEGMNVILTPVFTPALDTDVGKERLCTQLLEIEKTEQGYRFSFEKLQRFVELALSKGITHFEISHLFTQWGAGFAPNIYGEENGVRKRLFGWDTPADSPAYTAFLKEVLPAVTGFFTGLGLSDNIFFHVSDEPEEQHIESYRRARDAARPYLSGFPVYDALSEPRFFDLGLTEHPIAATDHIEPFLEKQVQNLWAYTCCAQNREVSNRFLAMPSYRNRIIGLQLYKYNLKGFLHWGYNFYFTQNARKPIDPYRVTDAGRAFPGGDPFSVYPGKDGPVPSLRLKVFHHGLQDMRALQLLESLCGRNEAEAAVEGFSELTFKTYPRETQYLLRVRESVNQRIKAAAHGCREDKKGIKCQWIKN